jgi:Tol biopolymer transport system component
MTSLLSRLKERKLGQWALAYLAGAWLILQILDFLRENFGWSPVVVRSVTVLLAFGFFAAIVLAWYHGEKGRQRVSGPELLMLSALLVIAAVAMRQVRGEGPDPSGDGSVAAGAGAARIANLTTSRLTATSGVDAQPSWSPDGEAIAFSSDRSGNPDIWILPLGGGGELLRLTDDQAEDAQPAWSPDGRQIAFASSRGHGARLDQSVIQFGYSLGGGIWAVPSYGGSPTPVLDGAFNPAWSPDGSRLVFDASFDGPRRIWTALADGTDRLRISSDRSEGAAHLRAQWSPDGRWIVYERQEGSLTTSSDLQIVPASGGSPVEVAADGSRNLAPSWATDTTIVFTSDRSGTLKLWMQRIDRPTAEPRGGPAQLTTGAGNEMDPTVAPNRRSIAFGTTRFVEDLWSLDLSSGEAPVTAEPRPVLETSWNDVSPALSPDGLKLAFASDRGGGSGLWTLDLAGGEPRALTRGLGRDMQPAWSVDGRSVAFFSDRAGHNDIYVVTAGGGSPVRLTSDPAEDINPFWSPDGSRIAFMSDRTGRQEVWVMEADGGNARRLTDVGATAHTARWSPDGEWILFTGMVEGNRDVWVVREADGETQRLTEGPSQNAHGLWSPDGATVYYLEDHRILWTVPFVAGTPTLVFDPGPGRRVDYTQLSPDGRTLYFTMQHAEGDLWLLEGLP